MSMLSWSRLAIVAIWSATAVACDSSAGPSVPLGSDFVLEPGESASVSTTGFQVRFDGVTNDSRCPADAVCITIGDAEVALSVVRQAGPERISLRTGPSGNQASIGEWSLILTKLEPYPYLSRPVSPSDYRVTLRVERLGPSQ